MAQILRITARRAGFRRAGIAHPATAIDHPADRFDADEIAALLAEPNLIVEPLEIEGGDQGDDDKSGDKNNPEPAPQQPEPEAGSATPPATEFAIPPSLGALLDQAKSKDTLQAEELQKALQDAVPAKKAKTAAEAKKKAKASEEA